MIKIIQSLQIYTNHSSKRIWKSKRNVEQTLGQNIKSDSKSFYAYVRNKQNVRDKVGEYCCEYNNSGSVRGR